MPFNKKIKKGGRKLLPPGTARIMRYEPWPGGLDGPPLGQPLGGARIMEYQPWPGGLDGPRIGTIGDMRHRPISLMQGSGFADRFNPPPFVGIRLGGARCCNEEDEKNEHVKMVVPRGMGKGKKKGGMVRRLAPGIGGVPPPPQGEVFNPDSRAHQQSARYQPDIRVPRAPAVPPPPPPAPAPRPIKVVKPSEPQPWEVDLFGNGRVRRRRSARANA